MTSVFVFVSERMLSQTAETVRDVSVSSHFMPPEKTVLQATNHYTGETFVYHVHLKKFVIDLTKFKSHVYAKLEGQTVHYGQLENRECLSGA